MGNRKRLLPALLIAVLALAITAGVGAAAGPQIYWSAWWTADLSTSFWSAGSNAYHFHTEWSYPAHGSSDSAQQVFTVDSGASPYDGFVLVRVGGLRAVSGGGPVGSRCEPIDTIRPDQPTRALHGWVNDQEMTHDEFAKHIASLTVKLTNDVSGEEIELTQASGIRRWATEPTPDYQPPWVPGFTCSFTRR